MRRSLAPREDARSEIEAAPPEMDRARLSGEARAKAGEHGHDRRKRLAEAVGRVAIIIARRLVLGERDGARNLVRKPIERGRQVVLIEQTDQPLVERGDASRVE